MTIQNIFSYFIISYIRFLSQKDNICYLFIFFNNDLIQYRCQNCINEIADLSHPANQEYQPIWNDKNVTA